MLELDYTFMFVFNNINNYLYLANSNTSNSTLVISIYIDKITIYTEININSLKTFIVHNR